MSCYAVITFPMGKRVQCRVYHYDATIPNDYKRAEKLALDLAYEMAQGNCQIKVEHYSIMGGSIFPESIIYDSHMIK